MIVANSMDPVFHENSFLPPKYEKYRNMVLKNFKLISFDEQLTRVPYTFLTQLKQQLEII